MDVRRKEKIMKLRIAAGIAMSLAMVIGCSKKDETARKKDTTPAEALADIKKVKPIPGIREESLLPGQEAILKECDAILASLQTSGVRAAFKKIRELSPLPDSELEPMQKQTAQQLATVKPRFGKIIGFERVRVEAKGQSVLECIYITKFERHILRWRFYFYKPKDKWFLNTFFWDDKIQGL